MILSESASFDSFTEKFATMKMGTRRIRIVHQGYRYFSDGCICIRSRTNEPELTDVEFPSDYGPYALDWFHVQGKDWRPIPNPCKSITAVQYTRWHFVDRKYHDLIAQCFLDPQFSPELSERVCGGDAVAFRSGDGRTEGLVMVLNFDEMPDDLLVEYESESAA